MTLSLTVTTNTINYEHTFITFSLIRRYMEYKYIISINTCISA